MRVHGIDIKREGTIFIVSAPSGTGKTTLVKALLKEFPEIALSISYTTRTSRIGEVSGRDYRFVTERKFIAMRNRGEFAEWAKVHGSLYGTPKRFLESRIRKGKDVLLDIDIQGAKKIKRQYPQAVSVFLLPPSWRELQRRLALRGTDRKEIIRDRLQNARREIRGILMYDYLVVNRKLPDALLSLRSIAVAERLKVSRLKGWRR